MLDYAFYFRQELPIVDFGDTLIHYDIFLSAYNTSERISTVFNGVSADKKLWLIHPEYKFNSQDYPAGEVVVPTSLQEAAQTAAVIDYLAVPDWSSTMVCIDVTGFMRATLCLLIAKLEHFGCKKIDIIYSEPNYYESQENTAFVTSSTGLVRVVQGLGGSHNQSKQEYLVLGVGYDHKLINEVVTEKDGANVIPLFSFPSLGADMYQQSVLRSSEAGEVTKRGDWVSNRRFAPANDPFAVAGVLQDIVSRIDSGQTIKPNIYLSPLATKAQTIGFVFYYLLEGRHRGAMSLIMPENQTYSRETSKGLKRLWLYTLEF